MNIIIVEDEMHSSRMLEGMIKEIRPDWQVLGIFESVSNTVKWLKENDHPDLIFLDIQLNDGICFSIFEKIKTESMVIFTTAYDKYAIRAFDVNSIDYLLKPVKTDSLLKAIIKFEQLFKSPENKNNNTNYEEIINAIKTGEKKYRKRILIESTTSFYKIETKDIAYFYTENRVTNAVTFDKKEHIIDFTIEKLELQLNPDFFFRANRSIIVNCDAVRKFENYFGGKLILNLVKPFDLPITISRLKATEFKEWLGK